MHIEVILVGLLVAVAALVGLARVLDIPYPIFLVVGGLALGFVPGVPVIELEPDLVLVIFLPPLLYSAAFFSSLRDLRSNLRPIGLLSVGLVIATTLTVAVVAHSLIDGLPWAAAFVLGAIVSPTDPIAAIAIAQRVGLPRRIATVVEGEALINDGTALVIYRVAVAAVLTGAFSAWEAGLAFVVNAIGGIAIGLLVGYVVAFIRRRIDDPPVEITISLFTAYLAYLPAEELEVSGVLAAVTAGIFLGWRAPQLTTPETRMQGFAVWEILIFLLNSLLFILVGLQLPSIVEELSGDTAGALALYAVAVSLTVILTRLAWVWPATYIPRWLVRRIRERDPAPQPAVTVVVGWTGMRGAVSLAAAIALPLETSTGAPFPQRDLIVFLTFCVILSTLVLQGLTLPALVRRLDVRDDGSGEREEVKARLLAAQAAIDRIEQLQSEDWVREDTADRVRGLYDYRRRRFLARHEGEDGDGLEERSRDYQRLRRELYGAERDALLRLRNERVISDEVMRRVERDIDLEETRLDS